ncbi:hypothetical protein DID78_07000 [Candidatus Marinamargulisbacteria bacterium SCGC AG-343-D04]|nr:hypothetical protein DID78_07000 [Candidatus Marinamargulisbacteria bacterium SCGC AG-343-D04]
MTSLIYSPIKKNATSSGFSIIELIIVLMISGIISSIILPNFSKIHSYAKKNAIIQQGHSLQYALESYFLDQGHYPKSTSIRDLFSSLKEKNILKKEPKNPYTNTLYSQTDKSGLIQYSVNDDTSEYLLQMMGKNNVETLFECNN